MSNFSVNKIFSYDSARIYSYLGHLPSNEKKLEYAFKKYSITPTGQQYDLKRLNEKMYSDYSNQVQKQIENQNNSGSVAWAKSCEKIGVKCTGNYENDLAAFNDAIKSLMQNAPNGEAMAYFAGVESEARAIFRNNQPQPQKVETYLNFERQILG